jgi:hypothetical protein
VKPMPSRASSSAGSGVAQSSPVRAWPQGS